MCVSTSKGLTVVLWKSMVMRGYDEMRRRAVGCGAFFHPFCSFLRGSVCDKGQKPVGPTRKLAVEPVQGYGRDYELLIGLCVDRFDEFYL